MSAVHSAAGHGAAPVTESSVAEALGVSVENLRTLDAPVRSTPQHERDKAMADAAFADFGYTQCSFCGNRCGDRCQGAPSLAPYASKHVREADDIDRLIDVWFKYHAPSGEQQERLHTIREGARTFALLIAANCPSCADRTVAMRALRECVMNANASIVIPGVSK